MAIIPLAEAAKLAGVSRQTIYRKAASGELSTVRQDDGSKGVDTSELARVFGALKTPEMVAETVSSDVPRQNETPPVTSLQAELDASKRIIENLEERVSELKEDRDRAWSQVEATQRLLTGPQPQTGSRLAELIVAGAIGLIAIVALVVLLKPDAL